MNYQNPDVDIHLQRAQIETDSRARQSDLTVVQRLIIEDRPALFLFSVNALYAFKNTFSIINIHPLLFFTDVAKWSKIF